MIYEVAFFVASDGKLHLSNGDVFARGLESSTDQPKDGNLSSFLFHGWPNPAQGGQEIKGPKGEIWKRIFIDDFVLKVVKSWECAFTQKAERYLHRHFKDYRQKGEWFRLPREQVEILLNIPNLDGFISDNKK